MGGPCAAARRPQKRGEEKDLIDRMVGLYQEGQPSPWAGSRARLWGATAVALTADSMKTFCHENWNTQAIPAASMAQAQALALFSSLLTVCVSEGSPEVWVRVHMEATRLSSLSLSVRCGVLGTNLISLVTVIWEGFVDAQGTKLAVLHPDLGTQWWVPASQARWETSNSVSLTLTLDQSKAKTSLANTTFCCEFVTFPHGSRVACGRLHSSDPGLSAPTPVPILQADLARILGTSGFLLLGFIFILYLLWQQKHWCFRKSRPSPTSTQAHMEAQLLRSPSAHGSFVSTENGLYASAGETLPHPVPNSLASTDCLEHGILGKCSEVQ